MLFTPEGKARVSIFSIAHLSDAERMFFVSMLLNEVLGWVRAQPGTGSLRAIVYMDEIFGFFPPVAEPASKRPLLTLLKQARAFGVGILLATQNPVDLDYKGLANAGTWFIGRLQTERDKDRLLEGLEGVAAGTEGGFDRQKMEETLAGLGKRIFLMYNVHEDAPVTFQTRWTMSYLAGPLTRAQIKTLMDPRRPAGGAAGAGGRLRRPTDVAMAPRPRPPARRRPRRRDRSIWRAARSARLPRPARRDPAVLSAAARLHPDERHPRLQAGRSGRGDRQLRQCSAREPACSDQDPPGGAGAGELAGRRLGRGDAARALLEDLDRQPYAGATLAALPAGHDQADRPTAPGELGLLRVGIPHPDRWSSSRAPTYDMTSNPGETEGEFRARLQLAARESRDATSDKLRQKYAAKLATLQQQEMRAQQAVAREAEQAKARKMQTAISLGATVLGAFLGRKAMSTGTLGRATTTMRDVGRSMDEAGDVKRAEETLDSVKQKRADLEAEFQSELDALEGKADPGTETLEKVLMRPRKSDITVDSLGLVWMPYWQDASGAETGAWG